MVQLTFSRSSISNFSFCLVSWAPNAAWTRCIRGCVHESVFVCVREGEQISQYNNS